MNNYLTLNALSDDLRAEVIAKAVPDSCDEVSMENIARTERWSNEQRQSYQAGEVGREDVASGDDNSYEAPLKDPSSNKSAKKKTARLKSTGRKPSNRREASHTKEQMKDKGDEPKKNRRKKRYEYFELQFGQSNLTPISTLSDEDLEEWLDDNRSIEQSSNGIKRQPAETRTSTRTEESSRSLSPSGMIVENHETVEKLFEKFAIHDMMLSSDESNVKVTPGTFSRLGATPSRKIKKTLSPHIDMARARLILSSNPGSFPMPPRRSVSLNVTPSHSRHKQNCDLGGTSRVTCSDKVNFKKPNPDTVTAFLTSSEWEEQQKVRKDWRAFVESRKPLRERSKSIASDESILSVPTVILSRSRTRRSNRPKKKASLVPNDASPEFYLFPSVHQL